MATICHIKSGRATPVTIGRRYESTWDGQIPDFFKKCGIKKTALRLLLVYPK
ncbi:MULTISPECIES: hypothetical protein [Aerosakkonema]|uniref:hypothetical protein n=1 Tax=Aerosakkonema TaxID=1246629 RepID=UPI0035BBC9D4